MLWILKNMKEKVHYLYESLFLKFLGFSKAFWKDYVCVCYISEKLQSNIVPVDF